MERLLRDRISQSELVDNYSVILPEQAVQFLAQQRIRLEEVNPAALCHRKYGIRTLTAIGADIQE
jgi:hypothetical protein